MKRLMMVMVMGLVLAATGFAQERCDSRFGGGHFSYNQHGGSGHFSGQTARGGSYEGGFEAHRRGFGGPSMGFDFAYTPAPAYVAPVPAYTAPAYCAPAYYPPVVGGVVVRRGFVRGHEFVGRDRDRRAFRR